MKRSLKDYVLISLKGMGMGAADVVPGVSGGTIAFISGIYEELINSLKSIEIETLKVLFKEGIPAVWKRVNGNFLAALFVGIGISIVTLSKVITHLLATYPVLVWSFFFGLIVASALMVSKKITSWDIKSVGGLLFGTALAYYITVASPAETPTELWFILLSGMLAICAMILPGISGAFILLLLGKYEYILTALKEIDIKVILTFMLGCVVGLVSFSHVLSWLFKKFHNLTIAVLTGFMLGSLNKVWPWKLTLTTRINSHGLEVPVTQESVLPSGFEGEAFVIGAIVLAIVGFMVIYLLEKFSPEETTK
ncbi:MAG: DUF368 domain-containing protein [Flavobacteriales bacterium]|nr:DUF368 domain-containing protein [Flavobacteriales bacterium]